MILDIMGVNTSPYFTVSLLQSTGSLVTLFTEDDISDKVIEFSIEEKERELLCGSLSFFDDVGGLYDIATQFGAKMRIEWGIKYTPPILEKFFDNEVGGPYQRGPMDVFVIDSPDVLVGGKCIKQVQFRLGTPSNRLPRSKTWTSGTVGKIIREIASLEICDVMVQSKLDNQQVSTSNPVIQNNQTNSEFLFYLASKFNVKLVYVTNPISELPYQIVVCDWDKQDSIDWPGLMGMKTGGLRLGNPIHYFDYGNNQSNILDGAKLRTNLNSVGGSSFVVFTDPQGKVSLQQTPSSQETTHGWELDPEAVKNALVRDPAGAANLTRSIVEIDFEEFSNNFDSKYKKYFKPVTITTAPEGNGYTAEIQCVYNPLISVGHRCWLGPPDGSNISSVISPRFRTYKNKSYTTWRVAEQKTSISDSGVSQNITLAR